MNLIKTIAMTEIVAGLLLIVYSNYLIISDTFLAHQDLHGYGLMLGVFGNSVGGVMAFAGTVYFTGFKYKILPQLILLATILISYFVYFAAFR